MMASEPERAWLSSYPPGVPAGIEDQLSKFPSANALFEAVAERHANRIAVSFMGGQLTYRRVGREARRFAGALQGLGVAPGDRVALMLPNCPQYLVSILGTLLAGAVVVNVNPQLTAFELRHQLVDSGARVILALDLVAPAVEQARQGTAVEHVILTGLGDLVGRPRRIAVQAVSRFSRLGREARQAMADRIRFRAVVTDAAGSGFRPVERGPGDLAFLQYTGGTTGVAKGAMLTHRNVLANILQVQAWLAGRFEGGPIVNLTLLPMYHVFSLTANALVMFALGGESILIADPRDTTRLVRSIRNRRFDVLCGTNTLFAKLLDNAEFRTRDFSGLALVVSGGMAMQRELAETWHRVTAVPITEGYGLTEASPVLTINPIGGAGGTGDRRGAASFTGSAGLPVPSTEIRIRRPDGSWAGPDEDGEICARGPQVMRGYWNRPLETETVIDADGWLATGDVGTIDRAGTVRIMDRLDDMMIVSGFNVHPAEIEDVVQMLPEVRECVAFGLPDAHSGERIRLDVVLDQPGLTSAEIIEHCRKRLTGYKLPSTIEIGMDPLPRTSVGKLLRHVVRERALGSDGR